MEQYQFSVEQLREWLKSLYRPLAAEAEGLHRLGFVTLQHLALMQWGTLRPAGCNLSLADSGLIKAEAGENYDDARSRAAICHIKE